MTEETTHIKTRPVSSPSQVPEVPHDAIEQAIKSIKYGVVQLIIQDGRIVQIDKTEKIRLV